VDTRKEIDILGKTLLAAAAHPDRTLRERLAERLDQAIESGQPLHCEREVRSLFHRLHRRHRPFLRPCVCEIAVRVVRLVFSKRNPGSEHCWLRITWTHNADRDKGYLINHDLRLLPAHRLTTRRRQKQYHGGHFQGEMVFSRLEQLRHPDRFIQAGCIASDGYHLVVKGRLPWKEGIIALPFSALGGTMQLDQLGFTVEQNDHALTLHATTPEAIIGFSAALARGDTLVLRGGRLKRTGVIVLQLRDFDGEQVALPARACYTGEELWLHGVLPPHLEVDDADGKAILEWMYPMDNWIAGKAGEANSRSSLPPRGPLAACLDIEAELKR
jgi:hypothetical protein